ncbi:MAG: malate--CoA ligase subunit beta [Gammaproteobacteria bacterium]|nr:malate--CoA ligase subunit beta [Gammaproteobacteria bacterium]
MDIHEYQAKKILSSYGVQILDGELALNTSEAVAAFNKLNSDICVVKAQVHSGARGKAGGIVLCKTDQEVKDASDKLFGTYLKTIQTGDEGKIIERLYIESGCDIDREIYLAFVMDRASQRIVMVASAEGGMSIEELAIEKPDSIKKIEIDPVVGLTGFQARELSFALNLPKEALGKAVKLFMGCYKAMTNLDMNMLEINPLVLTKDNDLIALDAKISFDDNAIFKHPEIDELNDNAQKDPREVAAKEHDLSYVGLDGDIGCIINGAGLAMASMDMIKYCGGEPANFLDIGGGASPERVGKAFELVLADKKVKAMLVNVYAGINRCDWIAEGLVQVIPKVNLQIPLIVRLSGTNVEEGIKIVKDSGLPIILADTLKDAAQKAVDAAKQ